MNEINGILKFLPKQIEENKLNENAKWDNPEFFESNIYPDWFSLVAKGSDVFYVYNEVLPKYKFHGKVLEIGAGTCWISSLIKKQNPGIDITASDVSLNALERGKKVDKIVGGGIDRFINCDAENIPFKDETFDVVMGSSIVHHFANPAKGISEIYRVLKKGGYYLSILELEANPFLGYIWQRIGTAGAVADKFEIKENVYSFGQYRKFFKSAGFNKVDFFLERDPKYKHHHWFLGTYYKFMSYFPDWVPKLIGSSVGFVSYK